MMVVTVRRRVVGALLVLALLCCCTSVCVTAAADAAGDGDGALTSWHMRAVMADATVEEEGTALTSEGELAKETKEKNKEKVNGVNSPSIPTQTNSTVDKDQKAKSPEPPKTSPSTPSEKAPKPLTGSDSTVKGPEEELEPSDSESPNPASPEENDNGEPSQGVEQLPRETGVIQSTNVVTPQPPTAPRNEPTTITEKSDPEGGQEEGQHSGELEPATTSSSDMNNEADVEVAASGQSSPSRGSDHDANDKSTDTTTSTTAPSPARNTVAHVEGKVDSSDIITVWVRAPLLLFLMVAVLASAAAR